MGFIKNVKKFIERRNELKNIAKSSIEFRQKYSLATTQNISNRLNYDEITLNNLIYEFAGEFELKGINIKIPRIMSIEKTLSDIINNKKSVSRFGDGEFLQIIGEKNKAHLYFDTNFDKKLQDKLIEVITSNINNHLVCLWDNFGSLEKYNEYRKRVAREHLNRFRREIYEYIDFNKNYGNSDITRPYISYPNREMAVFVFDIFNQFFNNKDIIIIEGEYTKFGINNDLLKNARTVKRIICPATNAWLRYEQVLEYALSLPQNTLILIALGMTATVLAYDLALAGFQAIDIGHLDIEYEWFLRNAKKPIIIPGKYTNDAAIGGGVVSKDKSILDLELYKTDIIKVIK